MKKILFTLLVMVLAVSAPAMAQDKDYEPYPYMFVGLQGGVQNTFNTEFNNWKTFTPTASVSFGGFFNPVVGARLHVNGIWNKAGVDHLSRGKDTHYNYNYLTPSADVLVNLCTLFGKKEVYPVNLIWVGGLGVNYAWEGRGRAEDAANTLPNNFIYADNDHRWAFNGRVGLILDVPLCRNVSLNLEGDLNHIVPGKNTRFNTDNLQFLGQLGLNFKFGYKKPQAEKEEYETRVDTIWYDEAIYTPRIENGNATWSVFYQIRESHFDADSQLKAIGNFLKDYRDCKITVKSYADRQTGNPRINMEYSKQRNEKAVKALTDAGVDPASITAEYFGDTVQPYEENDKNRVTIITASGLKDVKDKSLVKKYRTKENEVRVK